MTHQNIHLNQLQEKAIQHTESPLLIIAGAGSGKTTVITQKIKRLVTENKARTHDILAITFTRKAAQEMNTRLINLLGQDAERIECQTFHSFCAKTLRLYGATMGLAPSFTIASPSHQLSIIKEIVKKHPDEQNELPPSTILSKISWLKSHGIDTATYYNGDHHPHDPYIATLYLEYQNELTRQSTCDFDDLLLFTTQLLASNKDVLRKLQHRFQYIFVDEYQDINQPQYAITKNLAAQAKHLTVVGDFDQNIYSWRGANFHHILNFEKDYPDAKVLYLEQNYRSTSTIISAANTLIAHNKQRKEKNLWTHNPNGDKITHYHAYDDADEARFIAQTISELISNQPDKLADIAILYRTNAQSRSIEESLIKFGLPYQLVSGTKFYERKEIKDMLSYLTLIANPDDEASFIRCIQTPSRGIGKTSIEKTLFYVKEHQMRLSQLTNFSDLPLSSAIAQKLSSFFEFLNACRTHYDTAPHQKVATLLRYILSHTRYNSALTSVDTEDRIENISQLIVLAELEDSPLHLFLDTVALLSDVDQMNTSQSQIKLMTLHHTKGLEFTSVFITGLEEGLLPHYRSVMNEDKIEEERRLLYVGMTRAKKKLYFTTAQQRQVFGQTRCNAFSRFIKEIPDNITKMIFSSQLSSGVSVSKNEFSLNSNRQIRHNRQTLVISEIEKFKAGQLIHHTVWGEGIITTVSGKDKNTVLAVNFKGEKKKLMAQYAPIKRL